MPYYVYILATKHNKMLYTGITSNPEKRMQEHFEGRGSSFAKQYNINKLVYMEEYQDVNEAIHREKCIKRWKRQWKNELIEGVNPEWKDLMD